MKTMIYPEFQQALSGQGVPKEHYAFICPRCKTVQSATSFIKAGVSDDWEVVRRHVGTNCIGRFDASKGCDWSLRGLLQIHELEVTDASGQVHPFFELATSEQAQALKESNS